ncbi:MAG: heme biosynthesis HemY N-terminal domain-containing protein [Gammaproteobacteria bacterium]|nr:heme biosynthesis HemY N-terminal domain-containing protein [Gammaproteobacteria bacterium]
MKTLIALVLSLLLAVVFTLWVKENNGYVLIGYGHWTIEGSLALFALAGLTLFVLSYWLSRTLIRLWSMPLQLQRWNRRRHAVRARHSLTQGLVELAEGNWRLAERHLTRHAAQSETPLLNYLAAARAAQLQGQDERRDDYLQLAHQSMPSAELAVGLTQAELQLAHEQYEQALATLTHIRSLSPKHNYVLILLKRLYVNLGEWDKLEELLPELQKRKAILPEESRDLQLRIYRERMLAIQSDPQALEQFWQTLPKSIRQEPEFLKSYINLQVAQEAGQRVTPLIVDALQRSWDAELVCLFGRIKTDDPANQLAIGEAWLNERPKDPDLLLSLARLCLQNRLWGKARSYLEACIGIKPRVEAYQELGLLLERMDEPEKALECFRTGLGLERRDTARIFKDIGRLSLNHQPSESRAVDSA